jgi:hypothetical protein
MRKRLPYIAAAALALLAIVEAGQALLAKGGAPGQADWRAAADEVRAGLKDGDLIVFAPRWADQVGRSHLGDVMPLEMVAHADTDRYARIWEVAIRGAHSDELAGAKQVRESYHGRVRVTLYEKPREEVLYDFTSHAATARVIAGRAEPRTLEVDYRPRRGILAPAPASIEFSDVPLGGKLVGYTGLHDYFSRKNSDAPVDFVVRIDGAEKLRVRHQNDEGWRRFEIVTPAGSHAVQFEISSPSPAWRTFGFHAEVRK